MLSPPPNKLATCGIMYSHLSFLREHKVGNKFWVFPRNVFQTRSVGQVNNILQRVGIQSYEERVKEIRVLKVTFTEFCRYKKWRKWFLFQKAWGLSDCQLSRVHVAEDHTSTENGAWFNFWVRNGIRWVPHPMAGNLLINHTLAFLMFRLLFRKRIYLEFADCCGGGAVV